jgi:hypothetical protein
MEFKSALLMDLGGTSSRGLYCNEEGIIRKSEGGGGNPYRLGSEAVTDVLFQHLVDLDLKDKGYIDRIVIGMAGISSPISRPVVDSAFAKAGVSGTIELMSDAELTHLAAFGPRSSIEAVDTATSIDILVIAGTGSIAVSFSPINGELIRAGGLGHDNGDEGSGNWIGLQLKALSNSDLTLKETIVNKMGRPIDEIADVAELSVLLELLVDKYPCVSDISIQAGNELAKIVHSVYQQQLLLHQKEIMPCRVRCYGSVLKCSPSVRLAFESALQRQHPAVNCTDVNDVLPEALQFCH